MRTVLTIAGFDPSSGAGVTADLKVFAAHGLFGTACITSLTVQSTVGVQASHPVDGEIVRATLDCLAGDLPPEGVKIGMLSTESNICSISQFLKQLRVVDGADSGTRRMPVVLDPVLQSTSGRELLDAAGMGALQEQLLGLVDWITPNLEELAVLSGAPVAGREDVPRACRELQMRVERKTGRRLGVFATGGHMEPPDDFLLLPPGEEVWLRGERVVTRSTHGTGCALSSAFLSRLVLGDEQVKAAKAAKAYVAEALRTAPGLGSGRGPMNHLWPLAPGVD